jgi:hypothetical protein
MVDAWIISAIPKACHLPGSCGSGKQSTCGHHITAWYDCDGKPFVLISRMLWLGVPQSDLVPMRPIPGGAPLIAGAAAMQALFDEAGAPASKKIYSLRIRLDARQPPPVSLYDRHVISDTATSINRDNLTCYVLGFV